MKFTGIPVSSGITMNHIYKPKEKTVEVNDDLIINVENEINVFHNALKLSTNELELLRNKASKNKLLKDLEIFVSHKYIVNDPKIVKEVEEIILNNNLNSAKAYKTVMEKYILKFNSLENEYMKERSIDIIDVYKRVISKIIKKDINIDLTIEREVILVIENITPSMVLSLNPKYVKGIILKKGGITSHSSLMIKNLGIPLIIGIKNDYNSLLNNEFVVMNGESGMIISSPTSDEIFENIKKQNERKNKLKMLSKYIDKKTHTKDGVFVKILANINNENEMELALKNGAEGIGLFRTEYMYLNALKFPTEDELFITYNKVLNGFPNEKVIIRTFDIGGDKIPKYIRFNDQEKLRGLPLALSNVSVFKAQIKGLLRANTNGNLLILLPMVGSIINLEKVVNLINECKNELDYDSLVNKPFELGIMVEEKDVVNDISNYASKVDFFSIGTNDLLQSMYNVDRFIVKTSNKFSCLNPDFLSTIKSIIDASKEAGISTSMCGEMACDFEAIPSLIKLGIDSLSVSPKSILEIRHLISSITRE